MTRYFLRSPIKIQLSFRKHSEIKHEHVETACLNVASSRETSFASCNSLCVVMTLFLLFIKQEMESSNHQKIWIISLESKFS